MKDSQIAFINGSMNQDSVGMYVRTDQGQVVSRVNMRLNSKDGKKNANEKITGNTLVDAGLPKGANKCIGWCNDYKNDAIIYFIHNSYNLHCIIRYFINTNTTQFIWDSEPELELQDAPIEATVVEDMLYWVNGNAVNPQTKLLEPKSFIISKAVNGEYGDADQPLRENVFPLVKRPPRFAPKSQYTQDAGYKFNNLRKKQFQFKYCYEYIDKQRSAWSPISKIPLPVNEIGGNGVWMDDITINNRIDLWLDTGIHQVAKILVAAREANPNNTGDFFLFEEIEKYNKTGTQVVLDNTTHIVLFYNNKRTESINTPINNRYCDDVPLSGKDIILMDNKYLSIAYPLKGYDGIEVDYSLEAIEEPVSFITQTTPMFTAVEKKLVVKSFLYSVWMTVNTIYIPTTFYKNAIYSISFVFGADHYSKSFPTGSAPTANYPHDMRDLFLNDIKHVMGDDFADYVAGGDYNGIQLEVFAQFITEIEAVVVLETQSFIPVSKSLKRGQFHPFGLIYNDSFSRYNIVFGDKELFSPLVGVSGGANKKRVQCQWQINHRPPYWATSYRWCYIKNKTYSYFIYLLNIQCTQGMGIGEAPANGIPVNKFFINVNANLDWLRENYPNFIIPDYQWVNGDRIRVVGEEKSYEILSEWTVVLSEEGVEDPVGYLIDVDLGEGATYVPIVEIYRPNPDPQETIYLEIGEEFEIFNPGTGNRRHQGQSQDQSANLTTPAKGIFDFGDVYFRYRYCSNGPFPVEDPNFCDYYISSSIDAGRAGVKIDSEQKYLNRVVRSENFLQNTNYNLLNTWLFPPEADYFEASDLWGEITGIQEVGDILKVVQAHKETSIYIGKILAKQSDGNDISLDSSRVFGTLNKYIEDRGSTYIRSIVKNDRYLYYFDESTGELIRSSANGQLAISSHYHMRNWFEKKAKEIREYNGAKDVIISCDNDLSEVHVSFIKGNTVETIVFSEETDNNGWKWFALFKTDTNIPENFAFQGDTFVSFMDGELYLHNHGSKNTFYGQLQPCSLKCVINTPPYPSKRFNGIRINSTRNVWGVSFTIEGKGNYGRMKSLLMPGIINWKDDRLYSGIHKNVINRAGVEDIQLLYTGHDMVGEILNVELSNNDNLDVILGEIEVKFQMNN
jgi:hypothetical protein